MIGPRPTRLEEVEEFFFLGACDGWAGGNTGTVICEKNDASGTPEWREAVYEHHLGYSGYRFVDRWGIDPDSRRPSGHMFITHWSIPMWGMWVGGNSYNEDVYDFLQEVLLTTYRQQQFFGGRGPKEFRKGNLLYTNEFEGHFACFSGKESIFYLKDDGSKELAGSHNYWGGSFVFQKKS